MKNRDLAQGGSSLRAIKVFNGVQAEEEDAADCRQNGAEHGEAEDELACQGEWSEKGAVFPCRFQR